MFKRRVTALISYVSTLPLSGGKDRFFPLGPVEKQDQEEILYIFLIHVEMRHVVPHPRRTLFVWSQVSSRFLVCAFTANENGA